MRIVLFVLVGLAALPLRAAVVSFDTTKTGQNVTVNSITTTEGTFDTSKMVQINVTHYKGSNTTVIVRPDGDALPTTGNRAALLEDFSLSTAVVNFGGSATAGITSPPVMNNPQQTSPLNTSGLAFDFVTPAP